MGADFVSHLRRRLPKVPGISGKDEYFNAVVLVLLVNLAGEYCFLFEKRAPFIRQGGEVCFPGGAFDAGRDSSLMEAAVRETTEETGIPGDRIEIVGPLDTVVATAGMVDAFVAVAHIGGLEELRINPAEVEGVFTVPVSFFMRNQPAVYRAGVEIQPAERDPATGRETVLFPARELGLPEKYTRPWAGFPHKILVYRTDKEVIWGITARLVYDVVRRIGPVTDGGFPTASGLTSGPA